MRAWPRAETVTMHGNRKVFPVVLQQGELCLVLSELWLHEWMNWAKKGSECSFGHVAFTDFRHHHAAFSGGQSSAGVWIGGSYWESWACSGDWNHRWMRTAQGQCRETALRRRAWNSSVQGGNRGWGSHQGNWKVTKEVGRESGENCVGEAVVSGKLKGHHFNNSYSRSKHFYSTCCASGTGHLNYTH